MVGHHASQLSRIEHGPPVKDLGKLVHWARTLAVPPDMLWFKLPSLDQPDPNRPSSSMVVVDPTCSLRGSDVTSVVDTDGMERRRLLRLVSIAGPLLSDPGHRSWFDVERLTDSVSGKHRPDPGSAAHHAALNDELWRQFNAATSKGSVLPAVLAQVEALSGSLAQADGPDVHRRTCALLADAFQLAGEIYSDSNRYTESAHAYTTAATAAKEADAIDLWACAMTRHAFLSVYERRFAHAMPLLERAAVLARHGDTTLSTRHWVDVVYARALAGAQQSNACLAALDRAEHVRDMPGMIHNGGWLRFESSRLPEERATCLIELGQPSLASQTLEAALGGTLSSRRRGSVLIDLAAVAAQERDTERAVRYATSAIETAQQTQSGVIGRRLADLRRHLAPLGHDRRVRAVKIRSTP
jgi:tetratricopeptide (TPR) repeat protein